MQTQREMRIKGNARALLEKASKAIKTTAEKEGVAELYKVVQLRKAIALRIPWMTKQRYCEGVGWCAKFGYDRMTGEYELYELT